MVDEVSFKEMERKTIRTYHEDGLVDIFIGGYFMYLYIIPYPNSVYTGFLSSLPIGLSNFLYLELKKRITDPRLGYVRLTKGRTRSFSFFLFIMLMATGFITLSGLFYHMGIPEEAPPGVLFLNRYNLIFQGAVISIIFISLGWFMHLKRLYFYSVIPLLTFMSGYIYLDQPDIVSIQNMGASCLFTGVVITALGLMKLRRFVAKYPKVPVN